MRTLKLHLQSTTPLLQGRYYNPEFPQEPKESHSEYEKRTWKCRLHTDDQGFIFFPGEAFRKAVIHRAGRMSIKKKGNSTYTQDFKAGLLTDDKIFLLDENDRKIHKDDVKGTWFFVPSDGKTGGGKRVEKCFPTVQSWRGKISLEVIDDVLPSKVVESVCAEAGRFTGVGSMRPANGGTFGRFKILDMKWTEE